MHWVLLLWLVLLTTFVVVGARCALWFQPKSPVELKREIFEEETKEGVAARQRESEEKDANDLSSKRDWVKVIAFSLGMVTCMSLMLALIANPPSMPWLVSMLRPVASFLRDTFEDKNTALIYGMVFYVFWVSHSLALATKPGTSRKIRWLVRFGLIALIIPWAGFNNWVTLDLLGLGLAFAFAATMQPRVSFLRLTIVLMILAFVYDFVQVFITGNMIKAAENMMSVMSAKEGDLGVPFLLILPHELSWFPAHGGMLGLGDVVAALLIATAAQRVGKRTNSAWPLVAVAVGFVLSMLLAYAALAWFDSGQPALIYIVPICCGLVMLTAKLQGNFAELRRRAWVAPVATPTAPAVKKAAA